MSYVSEIAQGTPKFVSRRRQGNARGDVKIGFRDVVHHSITSPSYSASSVSSDGGHPDHNSMLARRRAQRQDEKMAQGFTGSSILNANGGNPTHLLNIPRIPLTFTGPCGAAGVHNFHNVYLHSHHLANFSIPLNPEIVAATSQSPSISSNISTGGDGEAYLEYTEKMKTIHGVYDMINEVRNSFGLSSETEFLVYTILKDCMGDVQKASTKMFEAQCEVLSWKRLRGPCPESSSGAMSTLVV